MLKIKKNVLFNILARSGSNIIESIKSCKVQSEVNPYIFVHGLNNLFYEAKDECPNPIIYEPNFIKNKNVCVSKFMDERTAVAAGIRFGLDNNCDYYCLMHIPCELDVNFTLQCIKCIKDEIIGCYSNLIDNGIELYNNLTSHDFMNIGPCFIINKQSAIRFNHGLVVDFTKELVNYGIFHHFPNFMVKASWLKKS